jgi:hypothetical protein
MAQERNPHVSRILLLDKDVGFMFALANELRSLEIMVIPATSVAQAEQFLDTVGGVMDLLVVNCNMPDAPEFARKHYEQNPSLPIVGIAATPFVTNGFRVAANIHDPEDRHLRKVRRWALIIQALVKKRRVGFG